MCRYRCSLPQLGDGIYLAYTGMETDLLFSKGMDLPGFASYPLLETSEGRELLGGYYRDLIEIGRAHGAGVILESPTWVANRDRGALIGHSPERLWEFNRQAIDFMAGIRAESGSLPTLISANIGPREDAYSPTDHMTVEGSRKYHSEQLRVLADTEVDFISAYTIAYPDEAAGMVLAAKDCELPVDVAFTGETDGRLPTGLALSEAIAEVDEATDSYASYFMINCAHPDHFNSVMSGEPWMQRLKGIVANASRCSHAELDNADTLDEGNPIELAQQIGDIRQRFPHINIVGGCCGTDMRHLARIAKAVT